jgi:hypothetical protein
VEKTFGWDPEVLWPRTTWWHVSELLRGNPRPLGEMADALEVRDELAEKIVAHAVGKGTINILGARMGPTATEIPEDLTQ